MPLWDCSIGGLKPLSVVALSLILGTLISFFDMMIDFWIHGWILKKEFVCQLNLLFITQSNSSLSKFEESLSLCSDIEPSRTH